MKVQELFEEIKDIGTLEIIGDGDEPMPAHFFLSGGMRSRHLTKDMIDEVKQGMYAERSDKLVKNPVTKVWVNQQEM